MSSSSSSSDIYAIYRYEIFNKSSSSPTILIHSKVRNSVFKIWWENDVDAKLGAAIACLYEKNVYESKIIPFLSADNTLPFLPCLGTSDNISVKDLYTVITGCSSSASTENRVFLKAFALFFSNTRKANTDYIKFLTKNADNPLLYTEITKYENQKVQYIELPYVKFNTFHNMILSASTEDMIFYIEQIVRGINHMYDNDLVHNDLHSGNIMISLTTPKKVLIFDWDRSYIKGIPNPYLASDEDHPNNVEFCEKLCNYSQCNMVTPGGYATDFYKILSYVALYRNDDFEQILSRCFDIKNYNFHSYRHNFVKNTLSNANPFFQKNISEQECTMLQNPDDNMKRLNTLFCPIGIIYQNILAALTASPTAPLISASEIGGLVESPLITECSVGRFNPQSISPSQHLSPTVKNEDDLNFYKIQLSLLSACALTEPPHLSPKLSFKTAALPPSNIYTPLNKNITKYQEKFISDLKNEKVKPKSQISQDIINKIHALENIPLNKVSYGDIRKAKELFNTIIYGPTIQTPIVNIQGTQIPPPRFINEIMEENEKMYVTISKIV